MAQKVLVIGSQGYIGSRLCGYLIDKGIYCKGIDTGFFKKSLIKKTDDFLFFELGNSQRPSKGTRSCKASITDSRSPQVRSIHII